MTTLTIRLPSGRSVPIRAYVQAWKTLRNLPADQEVNGFNWFPSAAGDILRAMRNGMHDRINRHDPRKGRKMCPDWQIGMIRDAHRINGRVVTRRFETAEMNRRFAHRLDL